MPRNSVLEREQVIPRPRAEVFAFFSNAANLERITPSDVGFELLTPLPIEMKAGAIIDHRIRVLGIPMRWRTRIDRWSPESSFVDVQERGPYAFWEHTHTFEPIGDDRTRMTDRVVYRAPLGPLGTIARHLFVTRMLERVFDHRRRGIEEIFGRVP